MEKDTFEYKLIKGRIAETIFELMFRDTKKFTVLHFGYESTVPQLAQYRSRVVMKKVLDQVDDSPDFILITENKESVYFIEVKYRNHIDKKELLEKATKIQNKYEVCYLFVISKDGFYFSPVNHIIRNDGDIEELPTNWVSRDIQNKYIKLAESIFPKL